MGPRALSVIGTAALLLTATGAAAEPQSNRGQVPPRENMRFRGMDSNKDGVITRREWRGSVASFRQHDWNDDDILSGDEVRLGARRPARDDERFDPRRAREFTEWTPEAFTALDHNRDGRLTRDEWHYELEAWRRADRNRDNFLTRAEFLGDPSIDMDREDRFEYLDVNNDSRIDRSEWHGSLEAFTWLDRNGDRALSRIEVLGDEEDARESDLFAHVDFNDDGRISPDEWHWSRRSFLGQDANRDGVISRDEFETTADAVPGEIGTSGRRFERTIVVDATQRWVDTGIDLRPGDSLEIRGSGTIRMSPTTSDTATPIGSNRRAPNAPLPDEPAGALIARIGDGPPLLIGDAREVRDVSAGGRLFLTVNDDHLLDNAGQYRATVIVYR